jgi:hypothetical protein
MALKSITQQWVIRCELAATQCLLLLSQSEMAPIQRLDQLLQKMYRLAQLVLAEQSKEMY